MMALPVLLGLIDEAVTVHDTNWDTSKIGGKPDWMMANLTETTRCHYCQHLRLLVTQVYCPLENSRYHRTLYLLVCTSSMCQNRPHSWKILRCQILDASFNVENKAGRDLESSCNWNVGKDNLGHSEDARSATTAVTPEKWCKDEDDWSDDNMKSTDFTSELKNNTKLSSCELDTSCVDIECSGGDVGSRDCGVVADIQELSISDIEEDNSSIVVAEDLMCQPYKEVSMLLKENSETGLSKEYGSKSIGNFISYYMSVIEEPLAESTDLLQHEKELLRRYSQREGVDLRKLADMSFEEGKGRVERSGGEKYERTAVCHGDKMFHKFIKKMSICSQQILRYCWDGEPLMIRPIAQAAVPPCDSCGSPRGFEFQLMPSLVSVLRSEESSDAVAEFGTVLIYSCKESCWADSDTFKTECVIVQDDPDQHLFRRQAKAI